MQKILRSLLLLSVFLAAGALALFFAQRGQATPVFPAGSSSDYYQALIGTITGDWLGLGQLFTTLQGEWFWKVFLVIITVVPGVFLLHYLVVGAKHFDHSGEQVFYFPRFTRIVHHFAAVSFTLLAVTGVAMVLGGYLGGGMPIRFARYVHIGAAMVFVIPAVLMLVMWFKDMLPRLHDVAWMLVFGGYLSKEKKPVPAGKYNAGQKMYFWLATVGGVVMAYSGYKIWAMNEAALETVRLYTIIHNILGMATLAFFLTHVYMVVFAIAGSLDSMKTGYKCKEEVDILHSLYKY